MKLLNFLNTNTKLKTMKTKTYYLIITIFALIGVALLFSNYPIVIAIASFGFGISFREYTQEEVKEEVKEEVNHPFDN